MDEATDRLVGLGILALLGVSLVVIGRASRPPCPAGTTPAFLPVGPPGGPPQGLALVCVAPPAGSQPIR